MYLIGLCVYFSSAFCLPYVPLPSFRSLFLICTYFYSPYVFLCISSVASFSCVPSMFRVSPFAFLFLVSRRYLSYVSRMCPRFLLRISYLMCTLVCPFCVLCPHLSQRGGASLRQLHGGRIPRRDADSERRECDCEYEDICVGEYAGSEGGGGGSGGRGGVVASVVVVLVVVVKVLQW